jgi:hypothetical protein
VTKTELMGPSETGFWLETLRKDDRSKREYLPLTGAATELGRKPNDLLDEGAAGKLILYAPVLQEGLYVWPVTERGIPHTRLLGNIDGVEPVFRTRLQYGEYAVLSATDIKKIKIEQSVRPDGYICPELALHRIVEWQAEQKEEQTAVPATRMKSLATQVAWVFAYPEATEPGVVTAEMLRVDAKDLPRLKAQITKSITFEVLPDTTHSPDQPSQKVDGDESLNEKNSDPGRPVALKVDADTLKFNQVKVSRKEILEYNFRGEMSSTIVNAIIKASAPEDFHSVWEELLKLATQKIPPIIDVDEKGRIEYRSHVGRTKFYEKSFLKTTLDRALERAKSSHKTP